jgi:hypothetical protein
MVFGSTEISTDLGTFRALGQLRSADGPFSVHPATRYSDFKTSVPSGSALMPLYEVLAESSVRVVEYVGGLLG